MRVGVNGEMRLADALKLGADIAYLPYVQYSGADNHLLRGILSPQWGTGNGVLEAVLSYYVTPEFSIGVGGRYWAMWTTDALCRLRRHALPMRDAACAHGAIRVFLQAYRFAQPAAVKN